MSVRRRTDRRRGDLPGAELLCLLIRGRYHAVKDKPTDIWERLEDLRRAWQESGEVILELCVFDTAGVLCAAATVPWAGVGSDCGALGPGCRPWGWWMWSAPEPRRRFEDDSEGDCELMDAPYFREMPPPGPRERGLFETEPAYLDRLDLWLPGERELWQQKEERRQREQEEREKAWREKQQGKRR